MPRPFNSNEESGNALPAKGFLASTLIDPNAPPFCSPIALSQGHIPSDGASCLPLLLKTGWQRLDEDVLQGGFQYGRGGIACVNCDGSAAAAIPNGSASVVEELLYATLTSHLLSYQSSQAYFIDPLGNFSPFKLHESLVKDAHAQRKKDKASSKQTSNASNATGADESAEGVGEERKEGRARSEDEHREKIEAAMKALDRVAIMRVFDFAGLMEAIGEIQGHLVPPDNDNAGRRINVAGSRIETNANVQSLSALEKQPVEADPLNYTETTTKRQFIADSQAGSEDEADGITETDKVGAARMESPVFEAKKDTLDTGAPEVGEAMTSNSEPVLILIPSIHALISPFMRINHVRGHASMLQFARSLQHLTASYPLCCLMCNSTVTSAASFSSSSAMTQQQQQQVPGRREQRPELQGPSAFAVNSGIKPALGRTWPYCVDLNLLLTQPHFREQPSAMRARKQATLVEVLADRYSNRVGRWCAL